MEHSPFENLLKTLVPLIILIIWAMVSRPAKKRKQEETFKRRRRQETETQEPAWETSSSSGEQTEEDKTAKDDWKRSLEEVFKEMGMPMEQKPAPPSTKKPMEIKMPPPESLEGDSLEDLEPEVVPEKSIDEKMKSHLAIQEAAYTLSASPIDSQKVYATQTGSVPGGSSETPLETVMAKYAADELQKFIVWSELLGKPLALRDEER